MKKDGRDGVGELGCEGGCLLTQMADGLTEATIQLGAFENHLS